MKSTANSDLPLGEKHTRPDLNEIISSAKQLAEPCERHGAKWSFLSSGGRSYIGTTQIQTLPKNDLRSGRFRVSFYHKTSILPPDVKESTDIWMIPTKSLPCDFKAAFLAALKAHKIATGFDWLLCVPPDGTLRHAS